MTQEIAREIIQGLPSLYPLQTVEEEAILTLLNQKKFDYEEEGENDRAELIPYCPNCRKEIYNQALEEMANKLKSKPYWDDEHNFQAIPIDYIDEVLEELIKYEVFMDFKEEKQKSYNKGREDEFELIKDIFASARNSHDAIYAISKYFLNDGEIY